MNDPRKRQRAIVIMRQNERKFVRRVSFVTTPGYLEGPGSRDRAGLPTGTGPYRVITQLAAYDFDEETKRLRLAALHPSVTVEEIQANSSFEIDVQGDVPITDPPSAEEQRLLRDIDPAGIVLGK